MRHRACGAQLTTRNAWGMGRKACGMKQRAWRLSTEGAELMNFTVTDNISAPVRGIGHGLQIRASYCNA
ncbi:MAG: hypothetical protein A2W93_13695 [Bacteroidetes bacterium GWF2_43_63]|nr:MAG: hypothetical protein A2W94_03890 [Bacteroidetes bacterium GWE2_42_42]OFY55042.1 MAG: hypothetical protein A2W93_13695 [Bacteroidetes bacterium GWF2_43_63]HBG69579.1 hypothetical protein [Bacteroidales bacterium]HCB60682.1 hypothetical protein [Bacteroidales bacterium]HCY24014.1 hypothetical protein [Bacteroidales bacterium]